MASEILVLHIGAGALALVSATAALAFRKGGGPHRAAGTVFFLSMMVLSVSAIYIAIVKSLTLFILGGALVPYLLATAWMAARRKDGETGVFEIGALLVAVAANIGTLIYVLEAPSSASGKVNGVPVQVFFVISAVMALAAVLDLSVIVRGGVSGAQRIARHLWRMLAALFLAVGSFFIGQAKFFPAEVRHSHILFVPVIAVIVLLFFWLFRVLMTNWYQRHAAALTPQSPRLP